MGIFNFLFKKKKESPEAFFMKKRKKYKDHQVRGRNANPYNTKSPYSEAIEESLNKAGDSPVLGKI